MKIFISWSGRQSRLLAEGLKTWLQVVIQAAEPWISPDIEKGLLWDTEIGTAIEAASLGIVCVTRENRRAPWLLFEAGALSRTKGAHVCTFLIDLDHADVELPLARFQHTRAIREDVYKLVQTINARLGTAGAKPLPDAVLAKVFDQNWPELETLIAQARAAGTGAAKAGRDPTDMLREILELVRALARGTSIATPRGVLEALTAVRNAAAHGDVKADAEDIRKLMFAASMLEREDRAAARAQRRGRMGDPPDEPDEH